MHMRTRGVLRLAFGTVVALAFAAHSHAGTETAAEEAIARGRYLIQVGTCNDCHTPGFMTAPDSVPESDWLIGVPLGWRGPWGTTYASNLRLTVTQYTETGWVIMVKTRKASPPMPWHAVNAWTEEDARAVYRYIRHLGPKGDPTPAVLPPGVEPRTPYLDLTPKNLPTAPAAE